MTKYSIGNEPYVKVKDLRNEIKSLRKSIPERYKNFDADHQAMIHMAYNDIGIALYREELAAAKTPEEHRAIIVRDLDREEQTK